MSNSSKKTTNKKSLFNNKNPNSASKNSVNINFNMYSDNEPNMMILAQKINKFYENKVIPYNISLHGGEVTTLNEEDFHNVIKFIVHCGFIIFHITAFNKFIRSNKNADSNFFTTVLSKSVITILGKFCFNDTLIP